MSDVTTTDLMTRLAQHRAVGTAPATEHAWLAANGVLHTYEVGDVITAKGEPAVKLLVVLAGHLVIRVDRGAGSHKAFEWKGGDVGGVMPYSRVTSPPSDVVAEEATEVLVVFRDLLPEMIRECPVITTTLVHAMVDRARQFTSSDLRDEKLISLGKLASGLAHELNNPASAVVRSAERLAEGLADSEGGARELGAAQLSGAQLAAIDKVRAMVASRAQVPLSTVARADREDSIAEWLADHGGDEESAPAFAETAVTIEALDALAENVNGDTLGATLRWLAAGSAVRALSAEIETAARRIHDLVSAVKGFSYMDRAPTRESVDIRQGIADTVTMLSGKTRAKSVKVTVDLPADLPPAYAVGAELNQVWMNLIDNALDAVDANGHVTVSAAAEPDWVVVRIIDDGSGIPPEILGRIFDPFFTTKGVGKGSGLGLDIVRRLVKAQDGDVSVDSVPGCTELQVRLPVSFMRPHGAPPASTAT